MATRDDIANFVRARSISFQPIDSQAYLWADLGVPEPPR